MFLPSIRLLFAGLLAAPILPVANGAFLREMWRCAGCRDADGGGSKGFWLGGGGGPRAANRGRRRMMNDIDLVGGKTMTDEDYWDHHHEMKEKDGTEAFNSREMLPRMKLPSATSEPALAAQGAFGALIDNMVERQVPNGWADPDTKATSTGTLLSPQRRNTVAGPRRGTGAPRESEEDAMYSHWGRLHALRYDIDTTQPRFSSGTADANGNGSATGEGADVGVRTPAAPLATASVPVATSAMPQQSNRDATDSDSRRATKSVPPVATGGTRAVDSSPYALFPPPPGDGCTTCSPRSSCREDHEASDCGKKDDVHYSNGGAPSWQNPRPGTADHSYSGNLRPAPGSESVRSSERKTRHTRRALSKAKETEADRAEAERVDEAAAARVSSSSPRNFEEAQEAQVGGPSDHDVADVALTLQPVATPTPAPLASSPCIWDDHDFRILPDDFYASIVPPTREPLPPSEAAHAFPMLRRANAEESRQGSMSSTVTPYHGPHHLPRTQSNDTRSCQRTSGALLSAALLPGSRFGTDLRPAFNGSAAGRSEEIPPSQTVSGVGSLRLVDVDSPANVNQSQGRSPSMSTSTMGSNFTLCARSQARLQHHRDHTDLVYVQHNTGEKRSCTPVYFLRPPHLQVRDSRDDGARYAPAPDHRHEHAQQPSCCHSSSSCLRARVSQHYEEPGAAPHAASAVDIVDLAGFSGGVDGHAESLPGSQMSMQEFLLLLDAYNLEQARVVLSPVAEIACILLSDEDAKKCFHYALILQLVPRQFGCEKCCGTGGTGKQKTESGAADAPAARGTDDTPARRRGSTTRRTDGSCKNHGRCYSSGNVRKHQQPRPPEQDVTSRGDAAGAAGDAPWMSQWAAVEESPPHDADFRILGVRSTSSCAPQPRRTRLVNVDGVGLVAAGETQDKASLSTLREREEASPSDSDYTDDELRQATGAPDPSLLMTACSHPRAERGIIQPKASCGKRKVRDREAHAARALVLAGRSTSSDTVNEAGRSSDGLTASLPTYGLDARQLSTPEDTTPTNSNCQEEPRGHAHETETDAGSGTGHQERREQDESGAETLLRLGRLSRLRNSCSDVSAVAHCRADYTMECELFNYRMRGEFALVGEHERARGGCGFTSGHLKELKKKAAQRQHRCYCARRRCTGPRPAGKTPAAAQLEKTEPEAAARPPGAAATSSSSSPEYDVDDNAGAINAHFHEEEATQAKPSLRLPLPCAQSVLESSAVSGAAISDAETETTARTPSLLSASRESYYSGSTATSSWGSSSASRSSRRPSTSFMTLTPEEDGDEMMDERDETEMPTTGSKERETPIAHKKAETKAKTCTCSCPDPANIDHPPDHLAFVRIERLSTGEIVFKYMFQPDTADPNNDRLLVLSTEHVARVWEVPTKYGRLGQPIDARDWLQEEALLSGWHTDISRRDETGEPLKLGDVHCGYDLGTNNCQHLVFRFFRDVLKVPACGVFHSATAETVLENYRMEEWEVEQPVGGGGGRRSRARGPLGVRGNYENEWGSAFLGGGTKRPWPERVMVKMRQTKIDPINLSEHPLAWSLGLKARDELCDKSLERLACIRKFEEFQMHMAEGYHHKEDPPLFGCGRDLNRFTLGDHEQQD